MSTNRVDVYKRQINKILHMVQFADYSLRPAAHWSDILIRERTVSAHSFANRRFGGESVETLSYDKTISCQLFLSGKNVCFVGS